MRSFVGRVVVVVLLLLAVLPSVSTAELSAQDGCDPWIDPTCDPGFDPTFDPGFDPTYDPTLDPGFCDPWIDATCDPGFDPTFDPTLDPTYDPTLDPGFCDPWIDATCDPGFFPPPPTTTPAAAPPVLAFSEPSQSVEAVVSRADTSDDISVSQIPEGEVANVAASRLVLGLDALAELGAFRRSANPEANDLMRQVRDQVPSDGLTEDGYRREIERLAADLPLLVEQLEASGQEISPELQQVADSLDDETVESIANGETSVIDPQTWIAALADLSIRGGSAPIDAADRADDGAAVLGVALLFVPEEEAADDAAAQDDVGADESATTTMPPPTTTPPTTAPPQTTIPAVAEAPAESGNAPIALIGAAIAGLLALVAVALIRSRASAKSTSELVAAATETSKLSVNDLLDASRRMTASLDTVEISTIALAEAARLVESEAGLVAVRTGDLLEAVHHEPSSLFVLESLQESSLRRVTETGRSISTVATNEPVLVEVPMAMAAVPIVTDGTVTGAIMVVRVASKPFGRDDLEALEMLAPLVGSAFVAAEAHGSATALADVEPMTGLKNRRRLDRDLAAAGGELVAYIMLDVDHFKNFNDVNGHAAGDEALIRVASTMAKAVRPGDVVYRYGGEEFCVLLPNTTSAEAKDVAERIRAGVEACEIPGEENQPEGVVTVSVGVADTATQPVGDLVERADAALYEAKHNGRNQVRLDEVGG